MPEVGALLASGRDGNIFEYGPTLVLRRSKRGRGIAHEARTMQYVAAHGYPVPGIHEVRAGGTEIIMERLDGPTMMEHMSARPHTMARNARLLADLHDQLHEIRAAEWMPQIDVGGDRLLHLDLHPANVMMTKRGPVVIDWTNAASGHSLTDVGVTYGLLTCPRPPMPLLARMIAPPIRSAIARTFSRRYRGADFRAHVAFAAELKMLDPNSAPDEIESFRRLAARMQRR